LTEKDPSKVDYNATISFSEYGNTETIEMREIGQDGKPCRRENIWRWVKYNR
tara:strand:+ start:4320 stop:4475 length:156 start_codon:yes stop_codon:yes gene_type:complete